MSKHVLFYEAADEVLEKAPTAFAAHRARREDFRARGLLLMIGTFANVRRDGAMAVFTTREAAEAFAEGDPFVVNDVVSRLGGPRVERGPGRVTWRATLGPAMPPDFVWGRRRFSMRS